MFALTTLVLSTCSAPPPLATPMAALHVPDTVPMALRTRDVLAARLAGQLAVKDGCLVIRSASASWVVVWPSPGATWDPANAVVSLDGVAARVGDEVVLDGGEYPFPPVDPRSVAWVSPPTEDCLRIADAWVASSMSEHVDTE